MSKLKEIKNYLEVTVRRSLWHPSKSSIRFDGVGFIDTDGDGYYANFQDLNNANDWQESNAEKLKKVKTLVLFEIIPEDSFFFEAEGDLRDLDGIHINTSDDQEKSDRVTLLAYDTNGVLIVEKLAQPTKDWDYFIKCGFVC